MESQATPKISVVIPAYNEAERIDKTLSLIESFFQERNNLKEIIVVDDGSMDSTSEIVQERATGLPYLKLVRNSQNQGKGFSVREGILRASGDMVLFSDADLSTPIEELDKLLPWLDSGYEIVIGSRGLKESDILVHQPFYREYMGKIFNLWVRLTAIRGIKDTQCGFKLFRGDVARDIFARQKTKGFGFDVEILYIAQKLGYRIKEVPIRWRNDARSRVNPILDSAKMFRDLLRVRFLHRNLRRSKNG